MLATLQANLATSVCHVNYDMLASLMLIFIMYVLVCCTILVQITKTIDLLMNTAAVWISSL